MRGIAPLSLVISLALATLVAMGCGRSGSGGDDEDSDVDPNGGPRVVTQPIVNVSGRFVLGTERKPASDSDLWIVDRSHGTYSVKSLDASGSFKVSVHEFIAGHRYSFHVVKDHLKLADVDFRASTDGVQAIVSYEGGYGFDLGEVTLALDARGMVDFAAPGATSMVGGSFRTLEDAQADFASLPLPASLAQVEVGAKLDVYDAATLRQAFHRRGEHAQLYAEALANAARLVVRVNAATDDAVSRVILHESGSWLLGSRLATDAETNFDAASRWSLSDFEVPKLDARRFEARAFSGGNLAEHMLAIVRIQPQTGPLVFVPRLLGKSFATPPLLTAVSLDGGALRTIDYASDTLENGLTRPFCLQGKNVQLNLASPRMNDDQSVHAGRQAQVDVSFDFYASGSNGKLLPLTAAATSFASPWNVARTESFSQTIQRIWTPATARLRFDAANAEAIGANYQIAIPAALLPARLAGKDVNIVRLRITQRARDTAAEATSILWLKSGC